MVVAVEEAKFHEGIKRVVSLCFFWYVQDLPCYNEMVDVDVGGNRRHVGWRKGNIFSLLDEDE